MRATIPIVAALLAAPGPAAAQPPLAADPPLAILAGCWEQREGDTLVQEQWLAPFAGHTMGVARTIRGTRLVAWEFMVVESNAQGVAFVATPSGKPSARFPLARHGDTLLEFSSPGRGFPSTVRYTLTTPDELLAQIEGPSGGATRVVDFRYRRVPCPAGGRR